MITIDVYMAGKIEKGDNKWRDQLEKQNRYTDFIFNRSGPFFISDDHGCFHGEDSHGRGSNKSVPCMGSDELTEKQYEGSQSPESVFDLCKKQIKESDIVFAWVDEPDAFGTLYELGMCYGICKPVFMAMPTRFSNAYGKPFDGRPEDLWFSTIGADQFVYTNTHLQAWNLFKKVAYSMLGEAKRKKGK